MSFESLILSLKVIGDVILGRKTGSEVEKELNNHFNGWTEQITNYEGEPIELEAESITVRPMYGPKQVKNGIQKIEAQSFFTELETEREQSTISERISAVLKGQWITVVRLNIENGNAEDLRPEGMNLSYVTTKISLREIGRQIRIAETPELQSDKLELKILYQGSIGEYRQELADTIDLLEHIQENMEEHVIWYLIELYHSGLYNEESDSIWPDKAQARKLGEFLNGGSVDLESLASRIGTIKNEIEDSLEQSAESDLSD